MRLRGLRSLRTMEVCPWVSLEMRTKARRGPRLPTGRKAGSREGDTVKAILQFLALHHIPAWRMSVGATKIGGRFLRFGVVGMSDIIGIIPKVCGHAGMKPSECDKGVGQWLAVEVKSATGTVTLAQQAFLDQVNAVGGKAFMARDVSTVARELGLGSVGD